MDTSEQESSGPGLRRALGNVPSLGLNLLQNRLELLALELREEKFRLVTLILWLSVSVILGSLALILVTLTLVFFSPEFLRPYLLAAGCLVYLGAAFWAGFKLRHELRDRPPPLESTAEQLRKDVEWIRSKI